MKRIWMMIGDAFTRPLGAGDVLRYLLSVGIGLVTGIALGLVATR